MKYLSGFIAFFLVLSVSAGTPAVSEIISKARAVVGAEEDLNGLVTVQMNGRIVSADASMPDADIIIITRKPLSKRLEVKVGDVIETTILNGQRGCMLRKSMQMKGVKMRLLTEPEMEHVSSSTRQFFSFYQPDTNNGETVIHDGIELLQGIRCHKLVYSYPSGISTTRYFSKDDYSLVASVSNTGVVSVPVGAQRIGGIRYPEAVEYYEDNAKLHTIMFDRIRVNKPLEAGLFVIPKSQEK